MPVTATLVTHLSPSKPLVKLVGPARLCLHVPIEEGKEETYILELVNDAERLQALLPTREFINTRVLPPGDRRAVAYAIVGISQDAPPGFKQNETVATGKELARRLNVSVSYISNALTNAQNSKPDARFPVACIKGISYMRKVDFEEELNGDIKV